MQIEMSISRKKETGAKTGIGVEMPMAEGAKNSNVWPLKFSIAMGQGDNSKSTSLIKIKRQCNV
jgi:hypothetical protein